MSKAKFEAARELIEAKQYNEARALLKTINHPMAAEWIGKIDKLDPPTKPRKNLRIIVAGIALLATVSISVALAVYITHENDPLVQFQRAYNATSTAYVPTQVAMAQSSTALAAQVQATNTAIQATNDALDTKIAATDVALSWSSTPSLTPRPTRTLLPTNTDQPTATDTDVPTRSPTNNRKLGNINTSDQFVARWISCGMPDSSKDMDVVLHQIVQYVAVDDWASAGKEMEIYSSNCTLDNAFQMVWYVIFKAGDGDHLLPYAVDWNTAHNDFEAGWYR